MLKNKFFLIACVVGGMVQLRPDEHYDTAYQNLSHGFEASIQGSVVSVHEMVVRFYYIQRLRRGINALLFLHKKGLLNLSFEYAFEKKGFRFKNHYFFDPVITDALHLLCTKKSIFPFFKVWRSLNDYRYMHSQRIMDEFVGAAICMVQRSIEVQKKKSCLHDELFIRAERDFSFEAMPLEELLNVLDLLIDEIPQFIEKYDLNTHITWKEWCKKHWFIAPLALAALGLRAYLVYNSGRSHRLHAGII